MSRVDPRVFLYSVAVFLSIVCEASSDVANNWYNCAEFDIGELEDYMSKLSLENVPTINMMVGQFKCPLRALPFGALKSDWARLLLLRDAQPEDSDFSDKLGRLFRILVVAYFRMEESFQVAEPEVGNPCSNRKKSSHGNGTRSVNREKETGKLDNPISDSGETNETARSFTWSTVLGNEEFIGAINTEPTTFTSFDVVSSADKSGNSHTIVNNISTTTDVASSPVGKQIDRNDRIAASDATIRTEKYTAVSDNYSDNNAFNTGTSGIDIRTVTKEERTPRAGIILPNNNHFAESQSTIAASFTGTETSKMAGNKIDPITEQIIDCSVSTEPMGTDSRLFNNTSTVSSFDVFETFGSTIENPKSTVESVLEKAMIESSKLTENTVALITEANTEFSGSTKQMGTDSVLFNTLFTASSPAILEKSTTKKVLEEATIKSISVTKGCDSKETSFIKTESPKLNENTVDLITEKNTGFNISTNPMETVSVLLNKLSTTSSPTVKQKSTLKMMQEEATIKSISAAKEYDSIDTSFTRIENSELTENKNDLITEMTTEFSRSTKPMGTDFVLFNTLSTASSPAILEKSTTKKVQEEATIKSISATKVYNSMNTSSELTENKNDLITEMTAEFSTATMPMRTSPLLFNNSSPISSFDSLEKTTRKSVEEEATAKSISVSEDRNSKKSSVNKIESVELAENKDDLITEKTAEFSTATNPTEIDSRLFNDSSTVSSSVILEKSIAKGMQEKATSISIFATEKHDSKETGFTTIESTKLLETKGNLITEQAMEFSISTKPMETNSSVFNSPSAILSPIIFEKSTVETVREKATTEDLNSATKSAQEKAMTKSISISEEYDSIQTNFTAIETSELPKNKVNSITETSAEFRTVTKPTRTSPLFSPSAILEKSTRKNVQEEVSVGKDRDSKETKCRGDFPVSNSDENGVGEEEGLKFATTRYGDSFDSNCGKSANHSKGNVGAGKSCVYSDKISGNGAATSSESFNQSPWNRGTSEFAKTPWNSTNSSLPSSKIRRPAIRKKPPVDNEFWKYIVASRKLASVTSTGRSTLETEHSDASTRRSAKSKKRESLNTNREKNFRWFYNFEQGHGKYSSNNQANEGTHIECNEEKSKIADEE